MVEAPDATKVDPNQSMSQHKSTPDGALAHQEKSLINYLFMRRETPVR